MERRDALKAAATLLAGSGLASVTGSASAQRRSQDPMVGPAAFPFIATDARTSLFYKDWGAGDGAAVFMHGWPFHSDMWRYQMLHLAGAGVRTIAYDQRGCGRSTDPGTGYDFDTLADDLAGVVEQLALRKVVLIGHSIGTGQIVRYLTRHGSDRVSGIVLIAPSMPFIQKSADNPDGIDAEHFERWRKGVAIDETVWLAKAAKPFAPEASPEMAAWVMRMVEENSLWALVHTNRVEVETDWRAELPKVTVPTLILHGDADGTCPIDTTGRRVAQLIPGSQLKVYPGATHGLNLTHVEQLNADLMSFIRG